MKTAICNEDHHERRFSVGQLAGAAGLSRQAYYQAKGRAGQAAQRQQQALDLVRAVRRRHPRLGTRKLYHEQHEALRSLKIGRDGLFALLRREGLLVKKRRRQVKTTDSRHGFRLHKNLLLAPETGARYRPRRPNEVFVSDITYIETLAGWRYLALISDAYSRKIVGSDLSGSLSVEGALQALDQALGQLKLTEGKGLIHHSDRGVQYCCFDYVERLDAVGARISMTERGSPYDNAQAERINGILKQEYGLDGCFVDDAQAQRAVNEAIYLYNEERPHLALGYRKPSQVHAQGYAELHRAA